MSIRPSISKSALLLALKIGIPVAALWLVWEQIHAMHFSEIKANLTHANWSLLILGTATIFFGITCMGFYDVLAFSLKDRQKLSAKKRWLVGATLFGWTNFIGFGPALRAWLYSRYGYTFNEIGRGIFLHYSISLCGLVAWACGIFFVGENIVGYFIVPLTLCMLFSFVLAKILTKLTFLEQFQFTPVKRSVFTWLAVVAYLEWGLTILAFCAAVEAFNFAQIDAGSSVRIAIQGWIGGMISLVPGGLGTSDAIWLHQLDALLINPDAAAALVLTVRLIIYVAPWIAAVAALYLILLSENAIVRRVQCQFITLFLGAQCVVLLFSVATPYPLERLHAVAAVLPLHFIESSHLISSILGFSLIFLLKGLSKGYRNAYKLTLILLAISFITNLINGLDLLAMTTTLVTMVLLVTSRKDFQREGHFNIDLPYLFISGGIGLAFLWIMGLVAFENVPYQPELWRTFEVRMQASRFLRSASVVSILFVLFLIRNAFRPKLTISQPNEKSIKSVEDFVQNNGLEVDSLLAGGGDKLIWWFEDKGFILYQIHNNKLLVFKNPQVLEGADRKVFLQAFMDYCEQNDIEPHFSTISPKWMEHLHDFGFYFTKIAEEAVIDIRGYTLQGGTKSEFRRTIKQLEKLNVSFEILNPPFDNQVIDQLRNVSDAWVQAKGGHELQFNACYFSPAYIQRNSVAVIRTPEHEIVAFVNLLTVPKSGESTIDFMRYKSGRYDNLMDYILLKILSYLSEQGFQTFSLGVAPMTDVGNTDTARLHEKLMLKLSERVERFYNYKGLRFYKGKFKPDWQPRYIAYRYPWNALTTLRLVVSVVRARSSEMRKRIARARVADRYDQFFTLKKP